MLLILRGVAEHGAERFDVGLAELLVRHGGDELHVAEELLREA